MENLSHPFSRKNYAANGGFPPSSGGKSMYDDVFGGTPKFTMNSLAPRLQDYTEIFGGFHSSRSSSIPVLDLPSVDIDEDAVDVRSSRFDYSEVFNRTNGVDFAVSFEDLVCEANGGYDSSDEAWSPAHSGSLSGETDPSICSGKSQSFPNADIHQSVNDIKQFNVSYHKAQERSNENISNEMAHTTHLNAIPGYTCAVDGTVGPQTVDSEERPYQLPNDPNYNHGFEERVVEKKRFSKSMSLPMNSGVRRHGSDRNPSQKTSKSGPITNVPLLSVSDISLRTKPSQLPPPSRPPPVLAVSKGESGIAHSKLKASKSYAFERVAGDKLSPFFDVKLDGYSSSATMQDAEEETRSKLGSTEEVMEGKEDLQSCMKLQEEDDMNLMEQNTISMFEKCNDFDKGGIRTETSAEERKRGTKTSEIVGEVIDWELDVNLFDKSAERKHRRARTSSQGSFKREETVAWREAEDFFEVETDNSWMSFEQLKAKNISKRDVKSQENGQYQSTTAEPFELKESNNNINAAKEAPEWEDDDYPPKVSESSSKEIGDDGRSRTTKGCNSHQENQKNGQMNETIHGLEANEEKLYMAQQKGGSRKLFHKDKIVKKQKDAYQEDCLPEPKQEMKATTGMNKNVTDASRKRIEMSFEEVFQREHSERQKKDIVGRAEYEKKAKERQEQEQREKQLMESWETEGKREIQTEAVERNEKAQGLREALEHKNERLSRIQDGGSEKAGKIDLAQEDYLEDQIAALTSKEYKEMIRESREQEKMELEASMEQNTCKIDKAHHKESNQEPLAHASSGRRISEMRPKEVMGQEIYTNRSTVAFKDEEAIGKETNEHMTDNAGKHEVLNRKIKKEQIERNSGTEGGKFMAFCDTWELNNEFLYAEDQPVNLQFKEEVNLSDKNQDVLQHEDHETRTEAVKDLPGVQEHSTKPNQVGTGSEKPSTRLVKIVSPMNNLESIISPEVSIGVKVEGVQFTVDKGVMREKFTAHQVVREWVDNAKNIGDALQDVLEDIGGISDTDQSGTTEGTETKENNIDGIPLPEETKIRKTMKKDREMESKHFETTKEERERQREREKDLMAATQRAGRLKERELENELLKRIEEDREREREREKDRMAVDSAIREARERSYSEARERAERAAFERASAEVRQRAMAEARERLEKASAEAREARTRAERAAVERATTEARQRAFGKAMAEKAHVEARDKSDKLRSTDIRFQSSGTSTGLRYTYPSSHLGVDGESPQRCKARLERYQRTAERAAKALAEKNMRDLVAQREQEERNRLAEILDGEVRRWSSGKEGNLRALLSTLQYILGPDGGWQPIPLTEVITSAAVKRAYRKATLCVHPDKLQQRGASIQQKYICEKVFDLLKDAWNKFNSEER